MITFPNAAYSRAALSLKSLSATTEEDITYTVRLAEHVVLAATGATHSDSIM